MKLPAIPTDDVSGPARAEGASIDPFAIIDPQLPLEISELCAAAVRFIASKYKIELDFSPDTLSLLDQYVRDARAEIIAQPIAINMLERVIGAYFGEVVRREFGGSWYMSEDTAGIRLDLEPVHLSVNPMGVAREALLMGSEAGWHAHFEVDPAYRESLEARLAALPEIDADDFYLPTTRYDALCIAVDALKALAVDAGKGEQTFGPESYAR